MKVGDMVRHCDAADWTPPLGNGLLVELDVIRPKHADRHADRQRRSSVWSVLWSGDGEVVRHHDYELRLVEALAVAEYKAAHAAKNKKRSAIL